MGDGGGVKWFICMMCVAWAARADAGRLWFGTQARGTSKGIYVAELEAGSGAVRGVRLAAELSDAGFQALHPGGKWMYSTCAVPADGGGMAGGVAAFRVNDDGSLAAIGVRSSGGRGACHVSIDGAGKVVFAANYGDGSICALPVKDDGSLGEAGSVARHAGSGPNRARQEGPHAHSVFVGPDDRFAYAPDLGIDKVMIYRILRDEAKLEPAGFGALPPGSGPRHMKFGKDGKFAYVLNELTLTVAVFERDGASGALKAGVVVPVLPEGESTAGMTCSEIVVSADGRHVYTANRDTAKQGRDSVSLLETAADGGLERRQTAAAGVSVPRNIGLDPTGRWLLVCGQESNEVAVLGVDAASGKLTGPVHVVKLDAPMCVTFAGK